MYLKACTPTVFAQVRVSPRMHINQTSCPAIKYIIVYTYKEFCYEYITNEKVFLSLDTWIFYSLPLDFTICIFYISVSKWKCPTNSFHATGL